MASKTEFRRDGNKYIALTGECPKGFKGILFVCYRGSTPGSVKEDVIEKTKLGQLETVEGADVPDDWAAAFEGAGVSVPRPVATADVVEPRKSRKQRQEEYELFHGHMAAGCDMITAWAASGVDLADDVPDSDAEPFQFKLNFAHFLGIIAVAWPIQYLIIWIAS